MANGLTSSSYSNLLARVRKTLIEGQARIERERVRIYWETGRIIQNDILNNNNRAEYGSEIFKRLSNDLNIDVRTLQRCVQFFKMYPAVPIAARGPQFSWSHYRKLITIPDPKVRKRLELSISEKAWSSEELAARIKTEPKRYSLTANRSVDKLLTPLCGTPYTYQITDRPSVATGKSSLRVDLGFGVFLKDEKLIGSLAKGDIVESRPSNVQRATSNDTFKLHKSNRTAKDLYTYWAEIEKVIDGDTVKVRFDLGFGVEMRETLRLRGLDCAEMDTKEGQQAKAFVQSHLKEEQFVIVRSSRSDKYDRYLADIFIPKDEESKEEELYLNNVLLEQGYAQRMD